jgi:hypothetical protein
MDKEKLALEIRCELDHLRRVAAQAERLLAVPETDRREWDAVAAAKYVADLWLGLENVCKRWYAALVKPVPEGPDSHIRLLDDFLAEPGLVEVSTVPDFGSLAFRTNLLPASQHQVEGFGGLSSGTRYYWRATACDNHNGETLSGQVRSFILHLDSDGDGLWDDLEARYPGLAPHDDNDHDGLSSEQEQWAGTCPTNRASVLKVVGTSVPADEVIVLRWSSVSNRWYGVDRSTNLVVGFWPLTTSIFATPPANVHSDAVHGVGPFFYRVRLEN